MTEIQNTLFSCGTRPIRAFQSRLIPTMDPALVIGVRMPAPAEAGKGTGRDPGGGDVLRELPHRYYEENNLHGLLISALPDYGGGQWRRWRASSPMWTTGPPVTF